MYDTKNDTLHYFSNKNLQDSITKTLEEKATELRQQDKAFLRNILSFLQVTNDSVVKLDFTNESDRYLLRLLEIEVPASYLNGAYPIQSEELIIIPLPKIIANVVWRKIGITYQFFSIDGSYIKALISFVENVGSCYEFDDGKCLNFYLSPCITDESFVAYIKALGVKKCVKF